MAATGATAQARVRERWREIWIEVTPERDGKLQINFQGEYYRKLGDDDVRLVWVDDVRVQCAAVTNCDLEDLEPNGKPRAWTFAGPTSADTLSRDGSIAASGNVCASVWWGSQLRQVIDVRGRNPVRVTAVFRAIGPEVEPPEVVEHKAAFRDLLEMEEQTVTVTLKTPEAAKRASIRPLPLYDGEMGVAGNIEEVSARVEQQAHSFRGLVDNAGQVNESNSRIAMAADHAREKAAETATSVRSSEETVRFGFIDSFS